LSRLVCHGDQIERHGLLPHHITAQSPEAA
jgi:hypothetical protein